MPKPIICLSSTLRQYLASFRPCFSQCQWKYFVTVLLGLVECEGRSTLTGCLAGVGETISLSGLSRFLSRWPWSTDEVTAVWWARFRQQLTPVVAAAHAQQRAQRPKRRGRPRATVVTGYLIFDDSVHAKPKGRKMGGLGPHYSGTEKRVVRGHCLFAGLYVLLGRRCPLRPRLYRQRAVCEHEGGPFQSKIDLAVAEIEQFESVPDTQTHVLIDSWYHCKRVRRAAQQRGWDVSGGLKSNRKLRRSAADGSREWLSLAAYAATLQDADWTPAVWPSQQGGQTVYVHTVRTGVRKLGPTAVLITRPSLEAPLAQARYWGSTLLLVDTQTIINTLAIRWDIEDSFRFVKDLLGWEDVQLLDLTGIRTLVALGWVAAGFLYELGITLEWEEVQLLARLGGWTVRQDRKPGKIVLTRGLRRLLDLLTTQTFL